MRSGDYKLQREKVSMPLGRRDIHVRGGQAPALRWFQYPSVGETSWSRCTPVGETSLSRCCYKRDIDVRGGQAPALRCSRCRPGKRDIWWRLGERNLQREKVGETSRSCLIAPRGLAFFAASSERSDYVHGLSLRSDAVLPLSP